MRWLAAGLMAISLGAAAQAFRPLERRDWIWVWDRTVERTENIRGRMFTFLGPAPDAVRVVLLRSDYEAEIAAGKRKPVDRLSEALPKLLSSAPAVKLALREVLALDVDESVVSVESAGDAAQLYWTIPRKRVRSDGAESAVSTLLVRGHKAGSSTLRARLADGATRSIRFDVK